MIAAGLGRWSGSEKMMGARRRRLGMGFEILEQGRPGPGVNYGGRGDAL